MQTLMTFLRSEDGAVTVDWVVLTALIAGFNVALLLSPMRDAMIEVALAIGERVAGTEVGPED